MTGDLFVGRKDILLHLEELWGNSRHCPSVVLYGHRRMGKSSILQNMVTCFRASIKIIYFNMLVVGFTNTNELLYELALTLYEHLAPSQQQQIPEPQYGDFLNRSPYNALNHFFKQVDRVHQKQRFIIALDEFEQIERNISDNLLEAQLLHFLRGLIQTYSWFTLAFAGLHTLQEMNQDYWSSLYCCVKAVPVSFLSESAAQQLITQPSPDFEINYAHEAVQEIISLTNGQPYLIQLIGHSLVTLFNRQVFEERRERERSLTLQDVEAVIQAPEFYREANAYFEGVWVQASTTQPEKQLELLRQLCLHSMNKTQLVSETMLAPDQIHSALSALVRHDVLREQDNYYVYNVELMRKWVAKHKI